MLNFVNLDVGVSIHQITITLSKSQLAIFLRAMAKDRVVFALGNFINLFDSSKLFPPTTHILKLKLISMAFG